MIKKLKPSEAVAQYFYEQGTSTPRDNLSDLAKSFINDYGASDSTYICDAISEHADSYTSIYYYDIKKFIINNFEAVEDSINEFGWDGCGKDLYKAGQMAEFLQNERAIYNELEDVIKAIAIEYLQNIELKDDAREYNPAQVESFCSDLLDALENIDNNNRLDDIADAVNEFLTAWREGENE